MLAGGILLYGRVQKLTEVCEPVAEKVTRSLKNRNGAVEKIREISGKLSGMTSWIGGIFNRD